MVFNIPLGNSPDPSWWWDDQLSRRKEVHNIIKKTKKKKYNRKLNLVSVDA